MLRLSEGDDLSGAIAEFATVEHIRAAAIVMGIGMLRAATLGYWNGQEYVPHALDRPHELVALGGSIAEEDGRPSIHLHATVAGPDHRAVAGHVMSATVGVLAEIFVEAFPGRAFTRPFNESLGLRTLDLGPS